ncbi:MAG: DEAD/DEAH box helicase [Kiritimatiellia bacterium]
MIKIGRSVMPAPETKTQSPAPNRRADSRRNRRQRPAANKSRRKDSAAWSQDQFQVAPMEGKTRFHDLCLPTEIMHAISDLDFKYCTPVQALCLPAALKGKDVAGKAQTGTGKTAAFLIAAFARFLERPLSGARKPGAPRMLVLAPTRELVIQIHNDAEALGKYCGCVSMAVYGGMDYGKQQQQLRSPCDIIAATPGRLLDFRDARALDLRQVEVLVIDEADRMLDMGFIPDVRKIVYSLPHKNRRQTMLFSATLSPEVMRLAERWMNDPVKVEVEPEKATVDTIKQLVYSVPARDKLALLLHLLSEPDVQRVLVFRNRRDTVDELTRQLRAYGVGCDQLSGDVPQKQRLSILEKFRSGDIKVLVATDVAGRGIHVENITHVINYDLPEEAEDYVHRIGRTGRAGAAGTAIAFACETGAFNMMEIEKFLGVSLSYEQPPEAWLKMPARPESAVAGGSAPRRSANRRHPKGGGSRRSDSRRPSGRRPDGASRRPNNRRPAGRRSVRRRPRG